MKSLKFVARGPGLGFFSHNPTVEKTWESVGNTLQEILNRLRALGAAPDPSWKEMPVEKLGKAMQFAEAKERLVCDELLRQLVRESAAVGTLPPLRSHFCAMRCLCALDTLGILHAEVDGKPLYPGPPKWPSEELLEWMLVSNWQQRHDTWLKLSAYAVATGNTFYSG